MALEKELSRKVDSKSDSMLKTLPQDHAETMQGQK